MSNSTRNFPCCLTSRYELGHEVFVICFCQLATDVSDENLPAVVFIELNGHVALVLCFSGQGDPGSRKLRGIV